MCPQVEQRYRIFISPSDPIIESEDCLYLNVFVPVDVSKFKSNLRKMWAEDMNGKGRMIDRSIGLRMVIDRFLVSERERESKRESQKLDILITNTFHQLAPNHLPKWTNLYQNKRNQNKCDDYFSAQRPSSTILSLFTFMEVNIC